MGLCKGVEKLLKKTLIKYLFVCSHVGKPRPLMLLPYPGKLFEIFVFCPKTRENIVVLDFLAVDNFDFTRKIVKKNGEKLGKMLGLCQN